MSAVFVISFLIPGVGLGLHPEVLGEDAENWKITVREYWSLLSPLIFSDHPKRPGDEDPSPPYNMLRNVLDMNAQFGGLNSALLEARKSVWVMNVVPTAGPNHLPMILDRGFVGVLHDWSVQKSIGFSSLAIELFLNISFPSGVNHSRLTREHMTWYMQTISCHFRQASAENHVDLLIYSQRLTDCFVQRYRFDYFGKNIIAFL